MKTSNSSNLALDQVDELGWQVVSPYLIPLKRVNIHGAELTYVEQGDGPMVVLVHGELGDFRTWSAQMSVLSCQYRVVSYSRRYHEPNLLPDGEIDYTYRRHIDDLICLIEKLGPGHAHLVGHSYGATVAALVAMERPDRVNSLILREPSLFSMLSASLDKVSLRLHAVALNVLQKLSENGEQQLAAREYVNIVVGKDVFDELTSEDRLVINQNAHTLGPMLRTYFEPTSLDQSTASKMTTPTLLISGELSPRIYQAISRELHNCLPVAESLTLPGASHGLHMDKGGDVGVSVMEFLSRN